MNTSSVFSGGPSIINYSCYILVFSIYYLRRMDLTVSENFESVTDVDLHPKPFLWVLEIVIGCDKLLSCKMSEIFGLLGVRGLPLDPH